MSIDVLLYGNIWLVLIIHLRDWIVSRTIIVVPACDLRWIIRKVVCIRELRCWLRLVFRLVLHRRILTFTCNKHRCIDHGYNYLIIISLSWPRLHALSVDSLYMLSIRLKWSKAKVVFLVKMLSVIVTLCSSISANFFGIVFIPKDRSKCIGFKLWASATFGCFGNNKAIISDNLLHRGRHFSSWNISLDARTDWLSGLMRLGQSHLSW